MGPQVETLARGQAGNQQRRQDMYTVNVWFGANSYAEVSETFATRKEADAFAARYTAEEYPDVTVKVFSHGCMACGSRSTYITVSGNGFLVEQKYWRPSSCGNGPQGGHFAESCGSEFFFTFDEAVAAAGPDAIIGPGCPGYTVMQ
jgi:hypothetical protein